MIQAPTLANLLSPNNIIIYMLVFTRISGLFSSAPFFSTLSAPMMTKIWFAGLSAFIFYPMVYAYGSFALPKNTPEFIILLALEFLIGYLVGFIANLILEGVRMTGSILSIQMGLSMSEALDPITGVSATEISKLYVYLATLIFLATGAYQILLITIFNSFSTVPMGVFAHIDASTISSITILFSQMFKTAFGLALPIFSVLFITDILLCLMSKMMPQMNIYMVALPVKIYIGLFLFLAFLSASNTYLQGIIKNYIEAISVLFT